MAEEWRLQIGKKARGIDENILQEDYRETSPLRQGNQVNVMSRERTKTIVTINILVAPRPMPGEWYLLINLIRLKILAYRLGI